MRVLFALVLAAGAVASVNAEVGDGQWLGRVPAKDAARPNPMATDPEAKQVGAKLFAQHCASCHAENGEGKDGKPTLHSEHLAQATPGQLFWLLTNGSLKNGMPSWSRLPEQQRWQLVTHVKAMVSH
jgi:mono/diheme cytochrome c family protein